MSIQLPENVLSLISQKQFSSIWDSVPSVLETFTQSYASYLQGVDEVDEDDAFEFVYDAYLDQHKETDDEDMLIASLLDVFFDLIDG